MKQEQKYIKNIKIDEETWKELSKKKIELNLKRIADVIKYILRLGGKKK
jgi:hypothetical protein